MRGGGLVGAAGACAEKSAGEADAGAAAGEASGGGDGGAEIGRAGGAMAAEPAGGVAVARGATTGGGSTAGAEGGTMGLVAGATVAGRGTLASGASEGFSSGAADGVTTRGGAGGAAASLRWVMAFKTSPGREMFDKSILVLISSSLRLCREAVFPAGDDPSAAERRYARTFSASCSSKELECVFFSVTPTSGSVSRMALLLTSSSRARSLMRTLLIRPFVSPCCS